MESTLEEFKNMEPEAQKSEIEEYERQIVKACNDGDQEHFLSLRSEKQERLQHQKVRGTAVAGGYSKKR